MAVGRTMKHEFKKNLINRTLEGSFIRYIYLSHFHFYFYIETLFSDIGNFILRVLSAVLLFTNEHC